MIDYRYNIKNNDEHKKEVYARKEIANKKLRGIFMSFESHFCEFFALRGYCLGPMTVPALGCLE